MTYPYYLDTNGNVITVYDRTLQGIDIPSGFKFNGADIPVWCWTLLGYHPKHPKVLDGSCLHDYLIYKYGLTRRGDDLFLKQLLFDEVPPTKAKLMVWAVRKYRQLICLVRGASL